MGIPGFYRWLVERYPKIVADAIEETPVVVNGVSVPINLSRKNPNRIEYDNLYLDMNGIIHPCFHPERFPGPKSYGKLFEWIFKYIDKIFSVVRPRSLLYIAIDGVAPRAKMNHQRARRFRAAKDAADEASRMESQSEGKDLAFSKKIVEKDSNIITPGTEFMSLLSSALRYYVHLRVNSECGWRGIKVIISDASVPGEGEHKIMSYIRLQRNLPGYRPNTTHCLYGLDADLIMLALATHEVHFSVLREGRRKVYANDKSFRVRNGSSSRNIPQHKKSQRNVYVKNMGSYIARKKFVFLHIWTLREYLRHDLIIPRNRFKTDQERLIDDFVFMCIFVGNDFLPHVPSLDVSEGAINLLMAVYKKQFELGGYLTNSFEINLKNVEKFVQALGSHEGEIFRKRTQVQEREKQFLGSSENPSSKKTNSSKNQILDNANPITDQVKLGEEGWKERFYSQKFEAKTADDLEDIRRQAVQKYVEGICWVMRCYYQGVCSWQWFYPYHYAPFASDFCDIDKLEIQFTIGKPFKPFDQLMGVLPAASAHALPFCYRKLMLDSSSPILDFYPTDFELDMNGKRASRQAICKLPFIEESHLLAEIAKVEHTLTEDEKQRNSFGMDVLLMHKINPLAVEILNFCNNNKTRWPLDKVKHEINPNFSGGMNGYVYISTESMCPAEINPPVEDMATIVNNEVVSFFYEHPPFHPHIPRPPIGVRKRPTLMKQNDVPRQRKLWHERGLKRKKSKKNGVATTVVIQADKDSDHSTVAVGGKAADQGSDMNTTTKDGCIGMAADGGSDINDVARIGDKKQDGDKSENHHHLVTESKKRKRRGPKKRKINSENAATTVAVAGNAATNNQGGSEMKMVTNDGCDGIKVDGGSEMKKMARKDGCDEIKADGGSDTNVVKNASFDQIHVLVGKDTVGGSESNIITNNENGVATNVVVVTAGGKAVADEGSKMNTAAKDGCHGMAADGGSDLNVVARIDDKKQDGGSKNQVVVTESKKRRKCRERKKNGVATTVVLQADKNSDHPTVAVGGKAADQGSNMKTTAKDGWIGMAADGGSDINAAASIGDKKQDGDKSENLIVTESKKRRKCRKRKKNGVATTVLQADKDSDHPTAAVGGKAAADQGSEMKRAAKDGCHGVVADGGSGINAAASIDDKKQDGDKSENLIITESKKRRKCRKRKKNGVATTVVLQADKDSDHPTVAVGGKAAADQGSETKRAAKDGCHGVVADGGSDINAAASIGDKKQDGEKSENHIIVTESKKRKRGGPKKRKINTEDAAATVTVAGNAATNNQVGSEMTKDGCDEITVVDVKNASFDQIHVLVGKEAVGGSENVGAVVTAGDNLNNGS